MPLEQVARIDDRLPVGVQIALGRCQRSVPGDLAEDVYRNAGIGHPRQSRMP